MVHRLQSWGVSSFAVGVTIASGALTGLVFVVVPVRVNDVLVMRFTAGVKIFMPCSSGLRVSFGFGDWSSGGGLP
jgi:hypothetical protein